MVDVAQENYLADLEAGTEGLIEPLLFNDVFGPCMNTPDLNRLACLSEEPDEVDAGVVLSPIRARNSYYHLRVGTGHCVAGDWRGFSAEHHGQYLQG